MKTLLWVVIGIGIALAAWIPLNMADPRGIPFGAAVLGIVGSFVGGVIVLVAVIRCVRHGSARAG
jgi:uncharacterized membrane protein YeaQ/YmgE (transglycosylase-associated protein family)